MIYRLFLVTKSLTRFYVASFSRSDIPMSLQYLYQYANMRITTKTRSSWSWIPFSVPLQHQRYPMSSIFRDAKDSFVLIRFLLMDETTGIPQTFRITSTDWCIGAELWKCDATQYFNEFRSQFIIGKRLSL